MIAGVLAIAAPLAATVAIFVLRRAAPQVALAGAALGMLGAIASLIQVGGGARSEVAFGGLPGLPLRLVADPLGAILSLTVAIVAACVVVYAVGYMADEPHQVRFFAELSFFAAAMQALVLAGDWVLFLAGWELIGFASYLLIGFWYEEASVPPAATRAFLTTRSADLGLYLGVFVLATVAGTTRIADTLTVTGPPALAAGSLLLLAAMGKSAQVPFHGWLQDAMVGPTPVSALLHSATLVAGGAILLVRASPLLPAELLLPIGIVGGGTVVLTGLMALVQRDLKRLLAASTSSQLGFMLLAVGAGAQVAALAHLVAHAAIKSALFLGAGIFQHAYGTTSLDELRGAGHRMRNIYALFALAALALAGVPPLAGFWSKGAIEAAALSSRWPGVLAPLTILGTLLTGMYVARALHLLWRGHVEPGSVRGLPWMLAGLIVLTVLSAGLGPFLSLLAQMLGAALPDSFFGVLLGLVATAAGLVLGWFTSTYRLLGPLSRAAETGFRIGNGWLDLAVRPALSLAQLLDGFEQRLHGLVLNVGTVGLRLAHFAQILDDRVIDGVIDDLVRGIRSVGASARRLQSGFVFRELVFVACGLGAIIVVLLVVR